MNHACSKGLLALQWIRAASTWRDVAAVSEAGRFGYPTRVPLEFKP